MPGGAVGVRSSSCCSFLSLVSPFPPFLPPLFIFSLSFFLVSPAPSPSLPREAGRISPEVIYFHAREALTECVGRG